LEEEAEERLANRPKLSLDEIYKRWACNLKSCKNYGHHCWVDVADDKHYAFDAGDAGRWAKSIPDFATIERPSERLRTQLIRKANAKQRDSNIQNTTSSHCNIHNHMHFNMPSPAQYFDRRSHSSYSPQTTPHRRRNNRRMPSTSPACSDPDGHAELDRYFDWLIKKYPADKEKLLLAKEPLHKRDLDLKAIRKLENTTLESWGMTLGIADKIRREIKIFQEEDIY
jgi:hypothetical protein